MADHYASGFTQHWDSFTYKPELIVGGFEIPTACKSLYNTVVSDKSQFINVGYATINGMYAGCPQHLSSTMITIKSILARKYLASYTGGVFTFDYFKANYYYRIILFDYVNTHNSTPSDMYVSVYRKWLPLSKTNPHVKVSDIVQDSLISLSIRGDTPTNDRFWVAFEYVTFIGVLSVEKEELLPLLPFPHRVPWEEIIVWIDTDAFIANPIEARGNDGITSC